MKALILGLIYGGFKDLREVDLSDMDLSHLDLSAVDLSFCNLQRVDFTGSVLDGVRFDYADLTGAVFGGNTLAPIFSGKYQNRCRTSFCGADLSGVNLSRLCMDDVNFDGSKLIKVSFKGASLKRASFQNIRSIRGGKILRRIVIQEVNFSSAILEGSDFYQAEIQRCDFFDTPLKGVDFNYASISSSRFGGASNLEECNLSQTEFCRNIISTECNLPAYKGSFHRPTLHSWGNWKHAHLPASEDTIQYWAAK